MNVLLDTHAAIWFITDDKKLPEFSKQIIQDYQNNPDYSPRNFVVSKAKGKK